MMKTGRPLAQPGQAARARARSHAFQIPFSYTDIPAYDETGELEPQFVRKLAEQEELIHITFFASSAALWHHRINYELIMVSFSNEYGAPVKIYNYYHLIVILLVINIGIFLFGYELGAASFLVLNLSSFSELYQNNTSLHQYLFYNYVVNDYYLFGLVASSSSLGAALSYPVLLINGNEIAKKYEIMISSLFYFVGASLEVASYYCDWQFSSGLVLLIAGRLLYGVGISTSMHSIPQYISEIVPAELRGRLGESMTT